MTGFDKEKINPIGKKQPFKESAVMSIHTTRKSFKMSNVYITHRHHTCVYIHDLEHIHIYTYLYTYQTHTSKFKWSIDPSRKCKKRL